MCAACLVAQSRPTLCDPVDCSPPGSSVHGILQARILEWVAMPSSKGSSRPGIKPMSLVSPALAAGFLHQCRLESPLCTVLPPNPWRLPAFSHFHSLVSFSLCGLSPILLSQSLTASVFLLSYSFIHSLFINTYYVFVTY